MFKVSCSRQLYPSPNQQCNAQITSTTPLTNAIHIRYQSKNTRNKSKWVLYKMQVQCTQNSHFPDPVVAAAAPSATVNEASSSSSRRAMSSTAHELATVSCPIPANCAYTYIRMCVRRVYKGNSHFPNISPDTLSNLCCNWSRSSSTAALN